MHHDVIFKATSFFIFSNHIRVRPWTINFLIIESLFLSFKTWSKEICSMKLKEKLPDCQNFCPLKVNKTEGNIHSLFNNVSRCQHLSAKKFLLPV